MDAIVSIMRCHVGIYYHALPSVHLLSWAAAIIASTTKSCRIYYHCIYYHCIYYHCIHY